MFFCVLLFIFTFLLMKEKVNVKLSISILVSLYSFLWYLFVLKKNNVNLKISNLIFSDFLSIKKFAVALFINLFIGIVFFIVYKKYIQIRLNNENRLKMRNVFFCCSFLFCYVLVHYVCLAPYG